MEVVLARVEDSPKEVRGVDPEGVMEEFSPAGTTVGVSVAEVFSGKVAPDSDEKEVTSVLGCTE